MNKFVLYVAAGIVAAIITAIIFMVVQCSEEHIDKVETEYLVVSYDDEAGLALGREVSNKERGQYFGELAFIETGKCSVFDVVHIKNAKVVGKLRYNKDSEIVILGGDIEIERVYGDNE